MQQPPKTICYVAAHSGGHIIPCLTLAEHDNEHTILFITSSKPLDSILVKQCKKKINHRTLPLGQHIPSLLRPFFLFYSCFVALFYLAAEMPKKIVTTGSIVAIPVCLAGWILGIPIELYELNATPGKTIRLLAWFAHTIHYCFDTIPRHFPKHSCSFKPYPIRFSTLSKINRDAHQKMHKKTILILGGSQGSEELNQLPQLLAQYNEKIVSTFHIIHQTGNSVETVRKLYQKLACSSEVFSYQPDLSSYYRQADIIISRAGAGAIFESLFFQKRTILIPLTYAGAGHQIINASTIAQQYPSMFTTVQSAAESINHIISYSEKI